MISKVFDESLVHHNRALDEYATVSNLPNPPQCNETSQTFPRGKIYPSSSSSSSSVSTSIPAGTTLYIKPSNTIDFHSNSTVSVIIDPFMSEYVSCLSFEVSREDIVMVSMHDTTCEVISMDARRSSIMGSSLLIPLSLYKRHLPPCLPHDASLSTSYSSSSTPSPYYGSDSIATQIPINFSSISSIDAIYVMCAVEDVSITEGYSRSTTQVIRSDGRYDMHMQNTTEKGGLTTLSLAPTSSTDHAKLLMHIDHSLRSCISTINPVIDKKDVYNRVRAMAEIVLNMPSLGLGWNDDVVEGGNKVVDWKNALCEVVKNAGTTNTYNNICSLVLDIMQKLIDVLDEDSEEFIPRRNRSGLESAATLNRDDYKDNQREIDPIKDLVDESYIFGFISRIVINGEAEVDIKIEEELFSSLHFHFTSYNHVCLVLYDVVSFVSLCKDCSDSLLSPICHTLRAFMNRKMQSYFVTALFRLRSEIVISATNAQMLLRVLHSADMYMKSLNGIVSKLLALGSKDEVMLEVQKDWQAMCSSYKRILQEVGSMFGEMYIMVLIHPTMQDDIILEDWSSHYDFRRGKKISYGINYLITTTNTLVHDAEFVSSDSTGKGVAGIGISAFVCSMLSTSSRLCMEIYMPFSQCSPPISRNRQRQMKLDINYMFAVLYQSITLIHRRNIIDLTGALVDNTDHLYCDRERRKSLSNYYIAARPNISTSTPSPSIVLSQTLSKELCSLLIFSSLLSYCNEEKKDSAEDLWKAIANAPRVKRESIDIANGTGSLNENVLIGNPFLSLRSIDDYILHPKPVPLSFDNSDRKNDSKSIISEFIAFGGLPKGVNGVHGYRNMVPSIEDLKEMKVKLIPLLCELNVHLSVAWMLNVLQLRYEMIGSVEDANNYPPLNELEIEIRKEIQSLVDGLSGEMDVEEGGSGVVYLKFTTLDIMQEKVKHGIACVCKECLLESMASAGHV